MTEPTTEKLAKAMKASNCPPEMIARARAGYYDDYKSELTLPCVQLVTDLRAIGQLELAQRAINGEFDGTPEESAAWFAAEGKNHLPQSLWKEFGYKPEQKSTPKGFGK